MESISAESLTLEQAIINLKQTTDTGLRYYAAWWLGKFRVKQPEVISALVLALEDTLDRTEDGGYPLRRNAAKALGKLEDKSVVPALIRCFQCEDYYVRESAIQSLEQLGDDRCIPHLIALLEGGIEKAVKVPGKPYYTQPYEAILEALGTLGAVSAIPLIEPFINHSFPKIQFASIRAMYQLTKNSFYGEKLVDALQGKDLQLRRSVLFDIGASGYVVGAKAVAETLAENSLKLISLKGLLEFQLKEDQEKLTETTLEIMNLMDSLL